MKISIITAVYQNKTISDALDSINGQTYKNVQKVIIDGGSDDEILSIIRQKINPDKDILISEPDEGIYDALNKGLQYCSGDVIGLLHSDDIFADNRVLEDVAQIFIENDIDVLYGNIEYVDKHDTEKTIRDWKSRSFEKTDFSRGWMPPHTSMFLRKSVYDSYDTSFRISADYDFIIRKLYVENLKYNYYDRKITKMKVGGASNANVKQIVRKMKEDYKIIKKYKLGGVFCLLRKTIQKLPQFLIRGEK